MCCSMHTNLFNSLYPGLFDENPEIFPAVSADCLTIFLQLYSYRNVFY